MMTIQQVAPEATRMQSYDAARTSAAVKTASSSLLGDSAVFYTPSPEDIKNASVMVPDAKVPKAEEIKKLIQSNGYPYKTDLYKAIAKILAHELN